MSRLATTFVFVFLGGLILNAQKPVFQGHLNQDTVLMGNYLEVSFLVENSSGDFTPPNFDGFEIVGGPQQSSSVSIINGKMTSEASYTYYLTPLSEGLLLIGPATLANDGGILRTEPLQVMVLPNPDGVRTTPRRMQPRERKPIPAEEKTRPKKPVTKL